MFFHALPNRLRNAVLVAALGAVTAVALPTTTFAYERGKGESRHDNARQTQRGPGRDYGHDNRRVYRERERYEWHRNRYVIREPSHRIIRALPHGYTRVHVGNRHYFEHGGHYYRRGDSGFILVTAPIGAIVARLPLGAITLQIGAAPYYFAGGVYYRHAHNGYVVVAAPGIDTPSVDTAAQRIVVQSAALNMRSGPGLDYSIVTILNQGENLAVIGTSPGWYYIRLESGQVGWVMAQYVAPVRLSPQG